MAFLGQLLSSLAHELNNPLTVVTGSAELGLLRGCDEATQARFRAIQEAGMRCTTLIRTFLAYARNSPPAPSPRDLNEVVQKASLMLAARARASGVDLRENLAQDLPWVMVDALQVEQIILNLVDNARQAIAQAGSKGVVTVSTQAEGDLVLLRVEDTGPGLPEAIKQKLFQPFQTTKPAGEGTGLGLSICRRFAEAHSGHIELERTGPSGTTFCLRLPACSGTVGAGEGPTSPAAGEPARTGLHGAITKGGV